MYSVALENWKSNCYHGDVFLGLPFMKAITRLHQSSPASSPQRLYNPGPLLVEASRADLEGFFKRQVLGSFFGFVRKKGTMCFKAFLVKNSHNRFSKDKPDASARAAKSGEVVV